MQVPSSCGVFVPVESASRPAQFLAPNFKFWAFESFICPASPTYSPTGLNHEGHLLAETGLESSANIFMLFDFRRTGETKHNILIVNQHLGLKDWLPVFWRSFSSSVLFLHYGIGNASTCSHLKSEMVTAYTIPSLSSYLAIHQHIHSSFYKLHSHKQNFCLVPSFKRVVLCFPRIIVQDTLKTLEKII